VNSEEQNAARALTVDAARAFIGQCECTFAKTMPWAPHEYIVRRNVDNDKFVGFVKLIREQGERRKWGRYRNTYLDSRRMELLDDGRADSDHDHHQPARTGEPHGDPPPKKPKKPKKRKPKRQVTSE
jgi:hypothetical protein